MAGEAHLPSEALQEAASEDSGTLYAGFKRNRFLGVVFLGMGLVSVILQVSRGVDASGGTGPFVFQGLYDLFWVFCGAAYLQHPYTRLRDWMRRAAIASLSLLALGVVGVLIGVLVGAGR